MGLTAIQENISLKVWDLLLCLLYNNLLKVSVEGGDASHDFRALAAEFYFIFYMC